MYVLDLVGKLSEPVSWLRYASAFRWYGSALRDGLGVAAFAGMTIAGVALAGVGALLFERRDITE